MNLFRRSQIEPKPAPAPEPLSASEMMEQELAVAAAACDASWRRCNALDDESRTWQFRREQATREHSDNLKRFARAKDALTNANFLKGHGQVSSVVNTAGAAVQLVEGD